jgi:hypothetical protein
MVGIAREEKAKYSAVKLMVLQSGVIGYRWCRVRDATGNKLHTISPFFAIGCKRMLLKGRDCPS